MSQSIPQQQILIELLFCNQLTGKIKIHEQRRQISKQKYTQVKKSSNIIVSFDNGL